ncbi:MAG: PHP domain-containing protein [Chloroflexota bacterium]
MVYDFHTQTFYSDGSLSPVELVRRAAVRGYRAIGLTDHAGPGNLEWVVERLKADCELVRREWGILAVPGVELTHLPPTAIPELARRAKALGALVVVHGETPVEPVIRGTNRAAVSCSDVDILAHPGLLTEEEAALAAAHGVFIEVSARKGHCLANGHVVRIARRIGARLLVNSDAHDPGDLLTPEFARTVALGAGLEAEELQTVLEENPRDLLARLGYRPD